MTCRHGHDAARCTFCTPPPVPVRRVTVDGELARVDGTAVRLADPRDTIRSDYGRRGGRARARISRRP